MKVCEVKRQSERQNAPTASHKRTHLRVTDHIFRTTFVRRITFSAHSLRRAKYLRRIAHSRHFTQWHLSNKSHWLLHEPTVLARMYRRNVTRAVPKHTTRDYPGKVVWWTSTRGREILPSGKVAGANPPLLTLSMPLYRCFASACSLHRQPSCLRRCVPCLAG